MVMVGICVVIWMTVHLTAFPSHNESCHEFPHLNIMTILNVTECKRNFHHNQTNKLLRRDDEAGGLQEVALYVLRSRP